MKLCFYDKIEGSKNVRDFSPKDVSLLFNVSWCCLISDLARRLIEVLFDFLRNGQMPCGPPSMAIVWSFKIVLLRNQRTFIEQWHI